MYTSVIGLISLLSTHCSIQLSLQMETDQAEVKKLKREVNDWIEYNNELVKTVQCFSVCVHVARPYALTLPVGLKVLAY